MGCEVDSLASWGKQTLSAFPPRRPRFSALGEGTTRQVGCYNGEESPAESYNNDAYLTASAFEPSRSLLALRASRVNLPHRFHAVTDRLAPIRDRIRSAERLARNMGDHDHTDANIPPADPREKEDAQVYIPPAGISLEERRWNVLAVGGQMLTNGILMTYAIEDILDGQAVVWIASDGSARTLLQYIPGDRVNDVIFLSPGSEEDRRRPTAWNPLKDTSPDERFQVAEAVTAAFGSIYKQFWGPQSAMLLQTAVHANLDFGGSTLLGCLAMLSNDTYRQRVRRRIKDKGVRDWWEDFERWPPQQKQGSIAPLQNKLGTIRSAWPLRNILCQARNKLVVDLVFRGKILIVELKRAHLGSGEKVRLFGSLLLHDLMRAGRQRAVQKEPKCFVYINNAAAFAPDVIEDFVVSEESPFSVAIATTHLDRIEEHVERALLSACGTLIVSRSSYADAKKFYNHFGDLRMKEREFVDMKWNDLAVKPWAGRSHWSTFTHFPHEQFAQFGKARSIIARSLDQYGTPRAKVERRIAGWMRRLSEKPESPPPARRKR